MASDIQILLTETLDDRAGGDVDPALLVRAAVSRGKRARRRRTLTCGLALVTVAALGTALTVAQRRHDGTGPPPATAGIVLAGRAPLLPPAPGQPGASSRPDLVGSDPRVLHFSVDALTGTATEVTWRAGSDHEQAQVRGEGFYASVEVSRTGHFIGGGRIGTPGATLGAPAAVRIAGRPGTLRSAPTGPDGGLPLWSIQWQPTTGLWAQVDVQTRTRGDAERLASRVRFDVAHRCVLPFVLTSLPVGMAVEACSVSLSLGRRPAFFQGTLTIVDDVGQVDVRASLAVGTPPFTDGLRAGPYRVHADDGAYFMVAPPYWVDASSMITPDLVGRGKIVQVLSGLRVRGAMTDPTSW